MAANTGVAIFRAVDADAEVDLVARVHGGMKADQGE
jgi:hypothetical protein